MGGLKIKVDFRATYMMAASSKSFLTASHFELLGLAETLNDIEWHKSTYLTFLIIGWTPGSSCVIDQS